MGTPATELLYSLCFQLSGQTVVADAICTASNKRYATPFDHAPFPLSEVYCYVAVSVLASLFVRYPGLGDIRYSDIQTILVI